MVEISAEDLKELLNVYEWYMGYWQTTEEEYALIEKIRELIDE